MPTFPSIRLLAFILCPFHCHQQTLLYSLFLPRSILCLLSFSPCYFLRPSLPYLFIYIYIYIPYLLRVSKNPYHVFPPVCHHSDHAPLSVIRHSNHNPPISSYDTYHAPPLILPHLPCTPSAIRHSCRAPNICMLSFQLCCPLHTAIPTMLPLCLPPPLPCSSINLSLHIHYIFLPPNDAVTTMFLPLLVAILITLQMQPAVTKKFI